MRALEIALTLALSVWSTLVLDCKYGGVPPSCLLKGNSGPVSRRPSGRVVVEMGPTTTGFLLICLVNSCVGLWEGRSALTRCLSGRGTAKLGTGTGVGLACGGTTCGVQMAV